MTRVSAVNFHGNDKPQRVRNLKEHRAQHKKLEIGQILKYDTNGYRKRNKDLAASSADKPVKPEQTLQNAQSAQTNPSASVKPQTSEHQIPQAQQNAQPKPESAAQQMSHGQASKLEPTVLQTQQEQPAKAAELKPAENNAVSDAKSTAKSQNTISKNQIVLNERGTYDVKLEGQPTRTFSTQADAQKFMDNMTKPKANAGSIILNERGTYDVKLKGQPTRTFSTQADAQKFLDNITKNTNAAPKSISETIGQTSSNSTSSAEKAVQSKPEVKLTTNKSNLSPIEPGKAPFNKKFWGTGNIKPEVENISYNPQQPAVQLGAKSNLSPIEPGKAPFNKKFWGTGNIKPEVENISYKPHQPVVQLGAKSNLSPIEPGKAPFNKKFWGTGDIKPEAGNVSYKPQQPAVQLGAKSNLSPIEPGKAPFNKKFWGQVDGKVKDLKLSYTPETSSKVVLGKATKGTSKFSLSGLFKNKKMPQMLKTKGGKFGMAAALILTAGAGIAAAASSGKDGYTTTYIQSPNGYVDLLKGYEQLNGGQDNSAARLAKLIA